MSLPGAQPPASARLRGSFLPTPLPDAASRAVLWLRPGSQALGGARPGCRGRVSRWSPEESRACTPLAELCPEAPGPPCRPGFGSRDGPGPHAETNPHTELRHPPWEPPHPAGVPTDGADASHAVPGGTAASGPCLLIKPGLTFKQRIPVLPGLYTPHLTRASGLHTVGLYSNGPGFNSRMKPPRTLRRQSEGELCREGGRAEGLRIPLRVGAHPASRSPAAGDTSAGTPCWRPSPASPSDAWTALQCKASKAHGVHVIGMAALQVLQFPCPSSAPGLRRMLSTEDPLLLCASR